MRVNGNIYPEIITVESYLPIPGMAEVRLRENVAQLSDTLYEYDEYTMLMKDSPGLKEEIAANRASAAMSREEAAEYKELYQNT